VGDRFADGAIAIEFAELTADDVVWDLAAGMPATGKPKPQPRKRPAKKAPRRVNG